VHSFCGLDKGSTVAGLPDAPSGDIFPWSSLSPADLILLSREVHNLTSLDLSGHIGICHSNSQGEGAQLHFRAFEFQMQDFTFNAGGCITLLDALANSNVTSLSLARVGLCSADSKYDATCVEFLSALLLPAERGAAIDLSTMSSVTGSCLQLGAHYKLKSEEQTRHLNRLLKDLSPPTEAILSVAAYDKFDDSRCRVLQQFYSSVPDPLRSALLSAGDYCKVFVYPRVTMPEPPDEWNAQGVVVTVNRIDWMVTDHTYLWIRQLCDEIARVSGYRRTLDVSSVDVWWQRPQEPPFKIDPRTPYPLRLLGMKDGDVLVITDSGSEAPTAVASPSPHKDKLVSRLRLSSLEYALSRKIRSNSKLHTVNADGPAHALVLAFSSVRLLSVLPDASRHSISGNNIRAKELRLLQDRARLWCPDMQLVL
jgi:hypothetical protein